MSLPSAAAAPVSGARRPILMGPPCAGAVRGAASDAASATLRTAASVRTWMRVIGGAPLHRLAAGGGDSIAASPRLRLRLALRPRALQRLARPLHRLASDGGDSIADSPRLRLRLALRPRALQRSARPLHRLASDGGAPAPRRPAARPTTAPPRRGPRSPRTAGLPAECAPHPAGRQQDDPDIDGARNQEPTPRGHPGQ